MKNKPNFFFLITGVSQTGGVGGGGPPLGNFSHIIPFFSLTTILIEDSTVHRSKSVCSVLAEEFPNILHQVYILQ